MVHVKIDGSRRGKKDAELSPRAKNEGARTVVGRGLEEGPLRGPGSELVGTGREGESGAKIINNDEKKKNVCLCTLLKIHIRLSIDKLHVCVL